MNSNEKGENKKIEEEELSEKETILFRNIDADVDKYSIELEKQIQKLPQPLRFIKKYIHFYFLPRLENAIDELEAIRQTPNYDEKIVQIRPVSVNSLSSEIISCIDLLNNNNIEHPKISKMIFGTMKGNLGIYDFDTGRILLEVNLSKQNRVENLTTSTVKYFDTYQTRIAANCRGEINIYILSYNHSFTGINTEVILNTINPDDQIPPQPPEKLNLSNVVSGLKLSKDGYFLSVTDYSGGVRIFNFADIGIQVGTGPGSGTQQTNNMISESNEENNFKNTGESNKDSDKNKENILNLNLNEKKSTIVISTLTQANENKLNFIYVGRFLPDKAENFTILPNEAQQVDDKDKKNVKENLKDKKKEIKKGKNEEIDLEEKNIEEYNIKPEFDEEKGDISMFQNLAENHPWTHFVQKRFIFEDNSNSEYSTSTITVGLYIAFSNSTCFKFVSLNEYLTDKMKSIFKVKKIKNNFTMSLEDSMNLNSQMLKKERDFLQFIRQKLDPKKSGQSAISGQDQILSLQDNKTLSEKDKKSLPNQKTKNDPKISGKNEISNAKTFSDINNINSLLTKKEMNFTTCFNITAMNGQKELNKYNNLLGIGMIDGSILVWDCELHTDKFLLQKNSRFEITSISIDENYLICGTIKGQIYIYDLIEGEELFTCSHDPYSVCSFQMFLNFFPFMNAGFDTNERICIYNLKEAHKISKLIINDNMYSKDEYKISFYNKYLCDYNDKYLVFICEKRPKKDNINNSEQKCILDLINFSKKRIEILRNKPDDEITNFFNQKISEINTQLVKIEINTNNSNIQKDIKDNKDQSSKKEKEKDKDKKGIKAQKTKEENINQQNVEQNIIEPITKLDLKENFVIIYRVLDVLFKCYPNLAYSHKKGMSLKKVMKQYRYYEYPTFSPSEVKKEGLMNIKYLSSDLKKRSSTEKGNANLKKDLIGINNIFEEEKNKFEKKGVIDKHNSTQRKDIFYNSFKNIKERHHYKEERINILERQKKKILKELKEQNGNKKKKHK